MKNMDDMSYTRFKRNLQWEFPRQWNDLQFRKSMRNSYFNKRKNEVCTICERWDSLNIPVLGWVCTSCSEQMLLKGRISFIRLVKPSQIQRFGFICPICKQTKFTAAYLNYIACDKCHPRLAKMSNQEKQRRKDLRIKN